MGNNGVDSNPANAYLLGRVGGMSSNNALGFAMMSSMNNQSYNPYQSYPQQSTTYYTPPQPEPAARISYINSTEEPTTENTNNTRKRRAAADDDDEDIDAELARMEKRKKKLALQLEIDNMNKQMNEQKKDRNLKKQGDEGKERSNIEFVVRKTMETMKKLGKGVKIPFVCDDDSSEEGEENDEETHLNR